MHIRYIYLHEVEINVDKYISPMDPSWDIIYHLESLQFAKKNIENRCIFFIYLQTWISKSAVCIGPVSGSSFVLRPVEFGDGPQSIGVDLRSRSADGQPAQPCSSYHGFLLEKSQNVGNLSLKNVDQIFTSDRWFWLRSNCDFTATSRRWLLNSWWSTLAFFGGRSWWFYWSFRQLPSRRWCLRGDWKTRHLDTGTDEATSTWYPIQGHRSWEVGACYIWWWRILGSFILQK